MLMPEGEEKVQDIKEEGRMSFFGYNEKSRDGGK